MKKKMVAMLLVLSLMGTLAGCSASGGNAGDKAEQKHTDTAATSGGDNKADSGMEFVYVTIRILSRFTMDSSQNVQNWELRHRSWIPSMM